MKLENSFYNCVIVEDSEIDQLGLKIFLSRFPEFKIIGIFASPEKALQIINEIDVDIIFLDIQMPGISGLEFRKLTRHIPACVFVTYSADYALAGFDLDVLDYIVKPLKFERFEQTILKIKSFLYLHKISESGQNNKRIVYLKSGTQKIKLNLDEVRYVEAFSDYSLIVTMNDKKIISSNLGMLLQEPEFRNYIRIHRSYAVEKSMIVRFNRTKVVLNDGTSLPIGKTYQNDLKQTL